MALASSKASGRRGGDLPARTKGRRRRSNRRGASPQLVGLAGFISEQIRLEVQRQRVAELHSASLQLKDWMDSAKDMAKVGRMAALQQIDRATGPAVTAVELAEQEQETPLPLGRSEQQMSELSHASAGRSEAAGMAAAAARSGCRLRVLRTLRYWTVEACLTWLNWRVKSAA